MGIVWIRGQDGVLIRADAIIMLASTHGSLNAECAGGRTVRLADSDCPGALQLALLDEIRRAGADDRHAMVITPPAGRDSATWRREYADTLLELLAAHDSELPAFGNLVLVWCSALRSICAGRHIVRQRAKTPRGRAQSLSSRSCNRHLRARAGGRRRQVRHVRPGLIDHVIWTDVGC
jgi:hypothetical protein